MGAVQKFDHLNQLRLRAEFAWQRLLDHRHPGGLSGTNEHAWELEHRAAELLFEAAMLRYRTEQELQELLKFEAEYARTG